MTASITTEHIVKIGEQHCKVYASQGGMKTVWQASGEICGQDIQVKARSKKGALQAWVDQANDVHGSR